MVCLHIYLSSSFLSGSGNKLILVMPYPLQVEMILQALEYETGKAFLFDSSRFEA